MFRSALPTVSGISLDVRILNMTFNTCALYTLIVLAFLLAGCSERKVAAVHTFPDGCRAEIIGGYGKGHNLIYRIEVSDKGGNLIHSEGLKDLPWDYRGEFLLEKSGSILNVRIDDKDRSLLTSFLHTCRTTPSTMMRTTRGTKPLADPSLKC